MTLKRLMVFVRFWCILSPFTNFGQTVELITGDQTRSIYEGNDISYLIGRNSSLKFEEGFRVRSNFGVNEFYAKAISELCAMTNVYDVTVSGQICAGLNENETGVHKTGVAELRLSGSDVGISYQLYRNGNPFSVAKTGTGLPLTFISSLDGEYAIVGSNSVSNCYFQMNGLVNVTYSTAPSILTFRNSNTDTVYRCVGKHYSIGLNPSEINVDYEVYHNDIPTGVIVSGTGGIISFGDFDQEGEYSIWATHVGTGCQRIMSGTLTLLLSPIPQNFNMTGGGDFSCVTDDVKIGLSGSEVGIKYWIYRDGQTLGGIPGSGVNVTGDGKPLNINVSNNSLYGPGTYTIKAISYFGCVNWMEGVAVVTDDGICGSSSSRIIEKPESEVILSEEGEIAGGILLYPNPSDQYVQLVGSQLVGSKLVLFNLNGKEVMQIDALEDSNLIDTSALPSGLYTLQLIIGTDIQVMKVLVEH